MAVGWDSVVEQNSSHIQLAKTLCCITPLQRNTKIVLIVRDVGEQA